MERYIKEYVDDTMTHIRDEWKNQYNKYIDYLIGYKENKNARIY